MRNEKGQFVKGNSGYWLAQKRPELRNTNAVNTMFKPGHKLGKRYVKGQHASPNTQFKKTIGFPHCLDCGKQLASYRATYCRMHARIGERGANWKGGITSSNYRIRRSAKYRQWRSAVFERDNYTCQECGVRGKILNADHIKPFALFPELRFDLDNGRTLCLDCHKKTPTWGNKKIYQALK